MSMAIPKGYKQTKVGLIPEDWDVVQLGKLVEINSGDSPAKFDFSDSGIPYFKVEQLNNSTKYQIDTEYYISNATKTIKKGSLIFPKRGASILLNKIRLLKFDSFMDTNLMTLTVRDDKCHNEFLYYYIVKTDLSKIADTTSIPQINNKHINPYNIPLPPLKEQEKIAEILSMWDEAITRQEALIKAKEQFKKGLMQKLLSGEVRFDGFNDEWEEVSLDEIATKVTRKNVDSIYDKVFSNSATKGVILQNEYFDRDIANEDNLTGYYVVESGAFVYNPRISKSAPAGPISRNVKYGTGVVSPLYTVFKIKEEENIKFFEYYFKSSHWLKYMKSVANYGARHDRMNVTTKDFFKMPLPYPSKSEQQKIVDVLMQSDKEIDLLKNEFDALKEQKRGLMQKLLTGEVRVNKIKEGKDG